MAVRYTVQQGIGQDWLFLDLESGRESAAVQANCNSDDKLGVWGSTVFLVMVESQCKTNLNNLLGLCTVMKTVVTTAVPGVDKAS